MDDYAPKNMGGLGMSPLKDKNQALLLKWVGKIMTTNKNSFWFEIIRESSFILHW